jgi:nucleotide-binding universal stress UspA family protein
MRGDRQEESSASRNASGAAKNSRGRRREVSNMGKYGNILVAVDGSESGKNALLQAFKLAGEEKCRITVTSVVPPYEGEIETLGIKNIKAALRKPCDDALAEAEQLSRTVRTHFKMVCVEGTVHERIVDLADAENSDVIVMGRRGLSRLERAFVGNVTARVIGHTLRDVLVVPRGATVGWKKIVVATDGSRFSAAAAERAIMLAKAYGGELKVISVVDVPAEFYAEAPQAVEKMGKQATEYVNDVKKQAEDAGVKTETFVAETEAYEAIINLAKDQDADMIAMGSHGRTGLRRLLMGSVTEKVISHAPYPILVVKSV